MENDVLDTTQGKITRKSDGFIVHISCNHYVTESNPATMLEIIEWREKNTLLTSI